MLVNIKVTGGLNIESGQIDPKAAGGLKHQHSLTHPVNMSLQTCITTFNNVTSWKYDLIMCHILLSHVMMKG